jgi:hypothetical protein
MPAVPVVAAALRPALPRGVHLGYTEHGAPVYFATCADGRVLYGVHSPEQIDEAYVVVRLWAVLDREDPPIGRSHASAETAVLPFALPQARPQTA